ncbi:MAG: hypothetical protein JWM78_1875 [Verrucomicrobiaceae bacterium]|nr:hypothetical protein [Verrucomicrobiaceae bacterium]
MRSSTCDHRWRSQIPSNFAARNAPRHIVNWINPTTATVAPSNVVRTYPKWSAEKNPGALWLYAAIKFLGSVVAILIVGLFGAVAEFPYTLESESLDDEDYGCGYFDRRGKINPTTRLPMVNNSCDAGGNLYMSF